MSTTHATAPVSGSIGAARRAPPGGPDLLRLEGFGAVYYQRRTGDTLLFPKALADLLAAAREQSVLQAYLRDSHGLDDLGFATQLAAWRASGIVDAADRVHARCIDGRPLGVTLSAPLVTHIQVTQACNLACTHCYVPVTPHAHPDEMTTAEVIALLRELGAIGCPIAVLAGGEPMRRGDLFEILEDALPGSGLDTTLCTNATLVDAENAARLARAGLRAVNVSLDGPDAATHDAIRGAGQFARALRGARLLVEAGLSSVKLRVTVTAQNADRLAELAPVATALGVSAVVMKPFDAVGVASGARALEISRRRYLEVSAAIEAAWPEGGCPLVLSDGMPTRPPAFAPLIPTFGCVGGTTSATVLPDGRVVACGVFSTPEDWRLRDRGFQEIWLGSAMIERWRKLEANAQCLSCANLTNCGGGCRARAVGAGRGFEAPDPFAECSLYEPKQDAPLPALPLPTSTASASRLKRLPMAAAPGELLVGLAPVGLS